ncbi:MAG: hypothetical protein K2Q34_07080 [Alphaproteobacteria bacterium]|nr:hypothetical protein [Alphaproteobacteria bacterium]
MLFLRVFALAFVLTGFSFVAMAADSKEGKKEVIGGLERIKSSFSNGDLRSFLIAHRDRYKRNYLYSIELAEFDQFADIIGDGLIVGNLLLEVDSNGKFAIDDFISEGTEISPRLAAILTTPRSGKGDTLLMALAMRDENFEKKLETLGKRGVSVWEKDIYGNTASFLSYRLSSIKKDGFCQLIDRERFKDLTPQLWRDVKEYLSYIRGLRDEEITPLDFISTALLAVCRQEQTGVHNAFLLRDPSTYSNADVEQADALWTDFIRAVHSFSARKDTSDSPAQESTEQIPPLSLCVLHAVSLYSGYLKELQEAETQLISNTSRLGFVPLGTMSKEELPYINELYIKAIKHYVKGEIEKNRSLYSWEHFRILQQVFFRPSLVTLDTEQQKQLFRHQLFCTVGALYALNELYDKIKEDLHTKGHAGYSYKGEKKPEDKLFDDIDEALKERMPTGVPVNSRAIFQGIKDNLPEGSDAFVF